MKWVEAALWKEFDKRDASNSFISIHLFFGHTYNLNKILLKNVNCHTESISTGHSVYGHYVLKFIQEKTGSLSASK